MAKKNKRRYFFQKEIALYRSVFSFLILVGVGTAILTCLYTFFSIKLMTYVIGDQLGTDATETISIFSKMLGSYWFYVILGGILLICLATIFTHRFAGPIYRFEVSLDRMIKNDIGFQINLRKHDEGKILAGKINRFNSRLSSTFKSVVFLSNEMERLHLILRKDFEEENIILEQAIALNRKLRNTVSDYSYE